MKLKGILTSLLVLTATVASGQDFVHPGILHTAEDLSRIRSYVEGRTQPAYGSWEKLIADPKSSAEYKVQGPFPIISRADEYAWTKKPCEDDFNAAYYNALIWTATADKAHADKAMEIIRKYSAVLRKITPRDDPLCAGLQGFIITNAAELMRYTYPVDKYENGWTEDDSREMETMLREAFIPVFTKFHATPAYTNGNWGLSVLKGMIGMSVFLDDRSLYEDAIRRYLEAGYDNGSLPNYTAPSGQLQESGRDQAHCMLALGCMAEICEVAWKQGRDIWSALDNRLLTCYEYLSRYNLGDDNLPFFTWTDKTGKYCRWDKISPQARGQFRAVFEIAYAHYAGRKGLKMPYTAKVLEKIRPEGQAWTCDNPGFGTLLFWLGDGVKNNLPATAGENYVDKVNPFIDSHRSRWFFFDSASLPFGMVSLSTDTGTAHSWGSGYLYDSLHVRCFSHIHNWQMSGVAVMPTTGEFKGHLGMDAYRSAFSHEGEIAKPGYHKIHLDDYGVTAELTATTRVGLHRYTFPQDSGSTIIFDSGAFLAHGPTAYSEVWQVNETTIAGWEIMEATGRRPKDTPVYFWAELSKPAEEVICWKEGQIIGNTAPARVSGKDAGMAVRFATGEGEQVLMKVAISYTSVENARANMRAELPGWDFDGTRQAAYNEWNEKLGRIDVSGGTLEQQVKMYTDLWHALLGRHIVSDADGHYMDLTGDVPVVRRIPCGEDGKPLYNHHNFDAWWGSHWSLDILWTLAYPEIVDDFCNTMLDYYRNGGLIPRGPAGGNYTYVMIGDPAVSFFAAAYNKGIRGYDAQLAYEGLRKNAFRGGIRDHAGYDHSKDAVSGGMEYYETRGYVPDGRPELKAMHTTGAAMTLEYAYQDWCLAQLAKALGKTDDYEFFMERSGNYRNVWDPSVGFMNARGLDGEFFKDFDPLEISEKDGFCESNAAIYSHFVPHDVPGLMELFGGRDKYIKRLDEQFRLSEPGGFFRYSDPAMKQFNWTDYGNQPGTGMAHMFNRAGAPWLSQKWVRKVKAAYSDITPYGGYRDDEDQGQMGALGVLMAIGLFEVDGGCSTTPAYELTSPVFDKVTIRLNPDYYPGGKFEIVTRGNSEKNMYIRAASLNGKKWDKCIVPHSELVKGGTLVLDMSPRPNKKWGTKTFAR